MHATCSQRRENMIGRIYNASEHEMSKALRNVRYVHRIVHCFEVSRLPTYGNFWVAGLLAEHVLRIPTAL